MHWQRQGSPQTVVEKDRNPAPGIRVNRHKEGTDMLPALAACPITVHASGAIISRPAVLLRRTG